MQTHFMSRDFFICPGGELGAMTESAPRPLPGVSGFPTPAMTCRAAL